MIRGRESSLNLRPKIIDSLIYVIEFTILLSMVRLKLLI